MCVCVHVCVCVYMRVWRRESKNDEAIMCPHGVVSLSLCVCVCVCVRVRVWRESKNGEANVCSHSGYVKNTGSNIKVMV